jgi:hypothetical protein
VLAASFKSWAYPAHIIGADSRNARSSLNGKAIASRLHVRLSECMPLSASKSSTRDLSVILSGCGSNVGDRKFSSFRSQIPEKFQSLYGSCLPDNSVEAWMTSYRPILARSDGPDDQVTQETKQRRSATA